MRAQSLHSLVLFLLLSSTSVGNAQVNLITNGSFESGTSPEGGNLIVSAGETDITGWTIASENVDYIEEPYWQASDGTRSLDLNGSSPAIISQSFPTVVGEGYQVRFALAGNTDDPGLKTLRVSAAATSQDFSFDSTGHSRANMGWVEETATFVATAGTTTLTLESLTPSARGPAVDDVRVYALVLDVCGDGNLDPGEECDDGIPGDGDGCDANCRIEPCWACGGEPSQCELALTAEAIDTAGDVGHYVSIAIGEDGLPVVSHYDDGEDDLKVTHCDDPSCVTRTTTVVADGFEVPLNGTAGNGDSGAYSQIVIGSDGLPFITYQAQGLSCAVSPPCTALRAAHCTDPACTTLVSFGEIDFTGTGPGYENSAAARPGGLPVVVWGRPVTATPGLWVSDCESVACNSATAHLLHGDANDRSTAVTIGGDGFPLIVFRDGSDDLRLAHCDDPGCSTTSLDTLDVDAGIGNSIAKGTDGFGIVSYLDFTVSTTVNTVKVIHCTSADCSAADAPVTIDTPDTAGGNTSIAIGAGGRPLIAYRDEVSDDLKLARCNDATCSSGAVTLTLDGGPDDVGVTLDIATTAGGTSYVAYADDTVENDRDLKLAICGPVCGDGNRTPDEECDDGGTDGGDGCSASCTVEPCWTCGGEPSTCMPLDCDDGSVCTQDSCNLLGVCEHDPTPVANCKTAAKSLLLLKKNGDADKLLFRWTNGEPLSQTQLGNPTNATEYALCIYKGAANDELLDIAIPAGGNWSELSDKGYKYSDPDATSSGIAKVLLKGNATENKSKVLLKGGGMHLSTPVLGDLPLPITAQLINQDTGVCVQAVFDTNIKKNTTSQFKAKAP